MKFTPQHFNAEKKDFIGNGERGRYVLLPGSDGRAAKMTSNWKNVSIKKHPRCHNLYLGQYSTDNMDIDLAAISTGMGAASADIIINELRLLGVRNFIRIGTAGSLQPNRITGGTLVIPTGSVRDEATTSRYLPPEVPAIPSLEFLLAAKLALDLLKPEYKVHFGIVHSKDSLYAREMLIGPSKINNELYMKVLKDGGVLASEMETSILFILRSVFNQENIANNLQEVTAGAILAIIGDDTPFGHPEMETTAVDRAVSFTLKIIEVLECLRNQV